MTRIRWFIVALALAVAAPTLAQETPKFGGCLKNGTTCFAPSVSTNVVAMSLKTGDVTSTFDIGLGYGVTFFSDRWYRTGFSVTAALPSIDGARRVQPAALFSFAEYVRLGVGKAMFAPTTPAFLLLGFGSDFGGVK